MKNTLTPLLDWAHTEIHPDKISSTHLHEDQLQQWKSYLQQQIKDFKSMLFDVRTDPVYHHTFATVVHTYLPVLKELADTIYDYLHDLPISEQHSLLRNFYHACVEDIVDLLYHVGYKHTAYFDLMAYVPKRCIDTIGGAEQKRYATLKKQLSKKGTPPELIHAITYYINSFNNETNQFVTYHDIQYLTKLVTALDNLVKLKTNKSWLHCIWEQMVYLNFNRTSVISYFKDYISNYGQEDEYIIQKEQLLALQSTFAEMPENTKWYCRSDRPTVKQVVVNAIVQEIKILDIQQEERDRDVFRKNSNYFVLDLSARSMMLLVQLNKWAEKLPHNSVAQVLSIMYSCFRPKKGRGDSPNAANALKKEIDASTVRNLKNYLSDLQNVLDERFGHYL